MMEINKDLVSRLIQGQFPQWSELPVSPVEKSGHDNRTFHLGSEMSIRLPSKECYVPQVEKELFWLPKLKPHLTLPISVPLEKGEPAEGYPWSWTINKWIEGETVSHENVLSLNQLAIDLAHFLKELQAIDSSDGPIAGVHNFYRGGSLSIYDEETKCALNHLQPLLETDKFQTVWDVALQSKWTKDPVWVHGDVAPGNLLVNGGRLCAVIDFGILGTGDPACDYAMAWTFFDDESRKTLFAEVECDEATWNRARGWALWKALITYDSSEKNSRMALDAKHTLNIILQEYEQAK
ncbi:aminoglycoside phosphotransferase family protein [Paenibacillus sp. 481]|uniref:aminoglycoside phosphotransferase family protein n=1 Tax=Paenibacillus sp. 481 TaxID=2835869 RepID=UPI001E324E65|nr:aminoglycoside phosphotransferase family protein [Paenibacillus sp. 481]UHA73368.1 aminoglycoside phosphotransferase family protein [Paenibacillus sp. 481]